VAHGTGTGRRAQIGEPGPGAANIDIFDFALADHQIEAISALDQGESAATDSDSFGIRVRPLKVL
jgi:hypothetical protein